MENLKENEAHTGAPKGGGPAAGAAWSRDGPICVFSTGFERSRRGVHAI
jgi:hypothetical protein